MEKTFFKTLERHLNQKVPHKNFEIIAMGIGGSSPTQQYLALINEGLLYDPDLVIQVFYTQNDIVGNSKKLDYSPYRPYFELKDENLSLTAREKSREQSKGVVINFLREKSYLLNLISDKINLIREANLKKSFAQKRPYYPPDYQIYKKNYDEDWQSAWNLTKRILLETKNTAVLANSEYLLVSLANVEQVESDYWQWILKSYPGSKNEDFDLMRPEKMLEEFTSESFIKYLSLLQKFKGAKTQNPNQSFYFWQDGHFNENGYNLVGESIADFIIEKQLFNTY